MSVCFLWPWLRGDYLMKCDSEMKYSAETGLSENTTISAIIGSIRIIITIYIICTGIYALFQVIAALYMYQYIICFLFR